MVSPLRPGETTSRSQVIEMFTLLWYAKNWDFSSFVRLSFRVEYRLENFQQPLCISNILNSTLTLTWIFSLPAFYWSEMSYVSSPLPPLTPTARGWRRVTYCFSPFLNRPYCTVPQMIQYSLVYLHSQRNSGIPVQSKNSFCWKWVQQACPHRVHYCYSSWSTF